MISGVVVNIGCSVMFVFFCVVVNNIIDLFVFRLLFIGMFDGVFVFVFVNFYRFLLKYEYVR